MICPASRFRFRWAAALAAASLGALPAADDATVFVGRWGERRPFHQAVFSIATGSQVQAAKSGSPSGKAIDNPLL